MSPRSACFANLAARVQPQPAGVRLHAADAARMTITTMTTEAT